jgi:hypothetical protein
MVLNRIRFPNRVAVVVAVAGLLAAGNGADAAGVASGDVVAAFQPLDVFVQFVSFDRYRGGTQVV